LFWINLCGLLVGTYAYSQVNIKANVKEYKPVCLIPSEEVAKTESKELCQITKSIKSFCPKLEKRQAIRYASIIHRESEEYGYDWRLIVAIMKTESNFDRKAKSHKGAVGLMQLMPKTAKWLSPKLELEYSGVGSLYNPEYNIKLGVHYLNMMQSKFGDLDKALVAYNKGPRKLMRELDNGGKPESNFLEKVKEYYSDLKNDVHDYPA